MGSKGSRLEAWMKSHKSEVAITSLLFVHQPTRKQCRLSPEMNTGRSSKQTTCLCRDTGGKGTLRAQRTGFNTLDNWGHKTPTQSKRKRNGKERVKGSWPETSIQYTWLHIYIFKKLRNNKNHSRGLPASFQMWLADPPSTAVTILLTWLESV